MPPDIAMILKNWRLSWVGNVARVVKRGGGEGEKGGEGELLQNFGTKVFYIDDREIGR